jgi:hypothetical protein
MTKILNLLILAGVIALCGCSQEEHVVFINQSGSESLFALSSDNERTRIDKELDLFSRQILCYQKDVLINLEIDGVIHSYNKTLTIRQLWNHRASRDEIVLLLARNKMIYICDFSTRRPLKEQPKGFPLVSIINSKASR